MRKSVFTLIAVGTLLLSTAPTNTQSINPLNLDTNNFSSTGTQYSLPIYEAESVHSFDDSYQAIEQVSANKTSVKSGSFTFLYNTNVRLDAGTNNRVLLVAKKGAAATSTHQKKVGNQTWYKVKVSGKSGWVLSTLLAPKTTSKAAVASTSAASGTYKTNYNSNIRANAGTNYKIVTLAKKGTAVKATSSKKVGSTTWYKVSANGKTGWVSGTLLTKTAASPAKKAAVKAPAPSKVASAAGTYKTNYNSNIRANAGTNHKIVTLAKKGTIVKVSASTKVGSATWYKVSANGRTGWVSGSLLSKVATTAKASTANTASAVSKASSSYSSSSIVQSAIALKGSPYRFGGTTPAGFDCSGFIQYVYKQNGKSVSRSTLTQFAETTTVSSPQPGDLVFFANTYRPGISHVGIYIGNNQFVHSGGAKAEVKSLNDVYWGPKFHSFKRF